jgi:hypothetical protein
LLLVLLRSLSFLSLCFLQLLPLHEALLWESEKRSFMELAGNFLFRWV